MMRSTDLYHNHSFTQYKNGSLSSINTPNDTNMFMYHRNFGSKEAEIHIVRAIVENKGLKFEAESHKPRQKLSSLTIFEIDMDLTPSNCQGSICQNLLLGNS